MVLTPVSASLLAVQRRPPRERRLPGEITMMTYFDNFPVFWTRPVRPSVVLYINAHGREEGVGGIRSPPKHCTMPGSLCTIYYTMPGLCLEEALHAGGLLSPEGRREEVEA